MVRRKATLEKGGWSTEYTFSRVWTVPPTVLPVSVGQPALKNNTFFVADDKVESEDLFVGLPVFRHLCVETKMLLEENIDVQNATDCSLEDTQRKNKAVLGFS